MFFLNKTNQVKPVENENILNNYLVFKARKPF